MNNLLQTLSWATIWLGFFIIAFAAYTQVSRPPVASFSEVDWQMHLDKLNSTWVVWDGLWLRCDSYALGQCVINHPTNDKSVALQFTPEQAKHWVYEKSEMI